MKTRFILHGGMMSYEDPRNTSFFKEVTKDLIDGDRVLWIGFARRDESERMTTFERDKDYILNSTEKNILVENAVTENLVKQVAEAKVIFVTGGDTKKLQADLESHPDFIAALAGKTYAGSSAGANICSTFYWGCSAEKVIKGMNMLPIRLMVHFGNPEFNSTEVQKVEMEKLTNELELILLPECEWRVIDSI